MKLPCALVAAGVLLAQASPARAASCAVTDVTPVAFGAYNPFSGTPVQTMGSFTYVCTLFSALDLVTINLSTGISGSYFPRTMLTGAFPLQYNLYTDAARTRVFGDGTGGTFNYGPVILAIIPITVNIYGRIPGSQNARQGSYTDNVTITMLF